MRLAIDAGGKPAYIYTTTVGIFEGAWYVPFHRRGLSHVQGPEPKGGDPKQRPLSALVLAGWVCIDVCLNLDLRVSLRLCISPGQLWKQSFFLPPRSPLVCPIKAHDAQNGRPLSSKGFRPISRSLGQGPPNGQTTYCYTATCPYTSGAFSRFRAPDLVVAALVFVSIEADRLPP